MNYFKEAVKKRLRFNTSKGVLSVEQLFDLKLTPLATLVRALKKELNKDESNDDGLGFLDLTSTAVDPVLELQFNVVKEIYIDKKDERDAEQSKAETKAHNQRIDELIAQKNDEALSSKSVAELEALRK